MPSELPNEDRLRLFDSVLTGDADQAVVRELEQLLDTDQTARDQFALLSQLDVDLRHAFRTGALEDVNPAAWTPPAPHTPPVGDRTRLGKRFWLLSLAVAASIAMVAGWIGYTGIEDGAVRQSPIVAPFASKPPAPVATLTAFDHAKWDGQEMVIGQTIREGDIVRLASGEAHISVGVGAEINATGPCVLRFVGRNRIQLDYGDVAVHVAQWAKGFTVVTDGMDVVDLGTTFTVSASKQSGVQASVIEGLVRVHPRVADSSGRKGVLVAEGSGYTVDNTGRGNALSEAPALQPNELELEDFSPYRPIDLRNTGIGLAEGDEDPHWRLVAGPKESFKSPQFAVVCKPDQRYLANEPDNSQWVSMPSWRTAQRNALYTFQTEFELDGYDLSTIQLFGRFLADNGVREVRVNGVAVQVESWVDNQSYQEFDHSQFRFVNVTDGLVKGRNVIEIDVYNGIFQEPAEWRGDPNPMALRVEWYAFGRQSPI